MARRKRQVGGIQDGTAGLLRGEVKVSGPLAKATAGLPPFHGAPIDVSFRGSLRIGRGKLTDAANGTEVHAATFLYRRLMILESGLLKHPAELRRVLTHELFHFVWWRLGNPLRESWEQVLNAELASNARGELGWSAQWRKEALTRKDHAGRSRRWREYVCEAFCDSAAWLFSSEASEEHTLARRYRFRRQRWFRELLAVRSLSI